MNTDANPESSRRRGRRLSRRWFLGIFALIVVLPLMLGNHGCGGHDVSTTSAAIGFVHGDGSDGRDSKLHRIIWPNQKVEVSDHEDVTYVPGNSRNYIINDGSVKGVGENVLGDRRTPIVAYTSSGTPVELFVSVFWTLNQSEPALRQFDEFCRKYNCATPSENAQGSNFAPSEGWNGMLAENFGPALDSLGLQKMAAIDDAIWRKRDPKLYEQLGRQMSEGFADAIRARLGYSQDLFCGSGSASGWSDPNKPGTGTYTCGTVRVIVDRVQAQNDDQADTANEAQADKDRRARAEQLYGQADAGFFLGAIDVIRECKAQATPCSINFGDAPSRR